MKKSVILFIVALFFLPGCFYLVRYDSDYKGKIIDADTGEPIEGVVVLGIWHKQYPTVAGGVSEFYDARETVTDKSGDFLIPGKGLRVISNLMPMNVLIFKAGYDYIGTYYWDTLKEGEILSKKIKWEGEEAIIPLKKLTIEERKKQGSPDDPPSEAPLKKVKHMLREIDKDRKERGLDARGIWGGERYE